MFNFKDQQIKITQKQNQYNQVKNLRKEISRQSPFKYASKKISFNVKNRSEFWDKLEQGYLNDKDKIDFLIMNEIKNILTNESGTDYQTEALDSVMYTPVSPVLATTLIMLNKTLFKCGIFDKYINNTENQVYAYTHWTGDNFLNKNSLVIDDPFGNETDKYMQILPGYNNIEVMKFYKGYQLYMTSYDTATNINNTTAATHTEPKFWGSYNIDTKRFQRIFDIQPSLDDSNTGTVGNISGLKGTDGTTETDIETLNKHPELDSYLYADGVFKRLMDSPYNSQSYQISVIRGGYGFGPINIACFLRAKEFNIERITDIISGILISEDSGMPLVDALKGIQEWRNVNTGSDIDIMFNSLSDIRILRYLEYIGSIFFTAILGSSLKEKPLLNLPLTNNERKTYDVGYLMGHNYDVFVQMFKNGIKNKIWLKESTEIFSFEVPCVLYGTTPTSGIFKIGDYVKNYSDSLLLSSEPLDYAFNISSILEKEKDLTKYITPTKGYTIFDFVTKGLNKCLITQIIKNISLYDTNYVYSLNNINNSCITTYQGENWEKIYLVIASDFLIAPRLELTGNNYNRTMNELSQPIDKEKCNVRFENWGNTNKFLAQYTESEYRVHFPRLIVNSNAVIVPSNGENVINNGLRNFVITCRINRDKNGDIIKEGNNYVYPIYLGYGEEDYKIYINYKQYEVINPIFYYKSETEYDAEWKLMTYIFNNFEENILSGSKKFNDSEIYMKDVYTNRIEKFKIHYTDPRVGLFYSDQENWIAGIKSNLLMKAKSASQNSDAYDNTLLPNVTRGYTETFGLKTDSIIAALVNNSIRDLIYESSGYQFDNFTKTSYNYSDTDAIGQDALKLQVLNNLKRLALSFLKLSTINSFCTSYSLDLLSLPDTTRQFYDIYKSYLSDFIDIKQEIQN